MMIETDRLRMHCPVTGPADGVPVVMVHGLLATGRFFDHLAPRLPAGYRLLLPDMRGHGRTEPAPIDATRGLRDWADDLDALLRALDVRRPVHLVGWSTGGAAVMTYALARQAGAYQDPPPIASITLIGPVGPYGFGGSRLDGTPCAPDWAGAGGGVGSPEVVARIVAGDRSDASPFAPRSMLGTAYWAPEHREPAEREDLLVDEVLRTLTGDDGYPGDSVPSPNWPGFAPGTRGILNAISGRYCNWSGVVDLDPKPPVLWTHGARDVVIADGSAWDVANLGKAGILPGWPGADAFPPQPMVSQIRAVLERYREAGGRVETHLFEESGHFPVIDATGRWLAVFLDFLRSVSVG